MDRLITTAIVLIFVGLAADRLRDYPHDIGAWAAKVHAGYVAQRNAPSGPIGDRGR